MKNTITLTTLLILATLSSVSGQTTFNVTKNISTATLNMPSQCQNCVVNIADGATLTFTENHFFQNTSFKGGNIALNGKSMTFWSPGYFTNTNVVIKNNASIVSSGALTLTNTTFTFADNSDATFWSTVDMVTSSMVFLGNSSMEATSVFNLKNGSSLIAGDGTSTSTAFIKFNGGTLNEFDNSYVTMLNSNNYYFNWSNYNGKNSVKTTNNSMNCGTPGKNNCSAPVLYGPSSLTVIGVGSNATMPVKLSAFNVKVAGLTANLTWTTDNEQKSSRFEIERSNDGINWSRIGTVAAKGNSTIQTNYTFNDGLKLAAVTNYRLKIIDQDETFAYSPIKTVKNGGAISEMKIYPNPATEYVVISSKNISDNMNVQLINQNGQIVKQSTGTGNIQMTVNGVQTGNYAVRVTDAAGSAQTFKLIIK